MEYNYSNLIGIIEDGVTIIFFGRVYHETIAIHI